MTLRTEVTSLLLLARLKSKNYLVFVLNHLHRITIPGEKALTKKRSALIFRDSYFL